MRAVESLFVFLKKGRIFKFYLTYVITNVIINLTNVKRGERMDTRTWKKMLERASELFIENKTYLCELDGTIGDGDHGVTIARIGECIRERVHTDKGDDSIKKINDDLSMSLMNVNGGSAGPLYGTLFEGMADGIEDNENLSLEEIKKMFKNALDEFQSISKAEVGQKTMVDSLYPAIEEIINGEGTEEEIFAKAAEAAEEGSIKTKEMTAKFGRARNFGEKSIGFMDPGSVSMALLFKGFAEGINN